LSTLAVKVERIRDIQPHGNADRLEIATVLGWQCVVQKGAFKKGDLCVYFPIDSILPQTVEDAIFGADSKIKLAKHRIRAIKLRGAISQGLATEPKTLIGLGAGIINAKEGTDLTAVLGVTKYEPPPPRTQGMSNLQKSWRKKNPHFHEYTDIENAKNYPDTFAPGERVLVSEKVHGTNFRAGWVPYEPDNLWKKLLTWLHLAPKYEFVFGSRKVQLQDPGRVAGTGFYERQANGEGPPPGNVYAEAVRKYNLRKIPLGYVVYGEIYGSGIQKGYTYGCKQGEHKVAFFDLMINGQYQDDYEFRRWATIVGLPVVPQLWSGKYESLDQMKALTVGDSVLCHEQPCMEGVVVKPEHERWDPSLGRVILKVVSDQYLLGDQSEFH